MSNPYVAPANELERTIVGIWETLLGVGPIGAEDDFFELGGHSLLATQLFSRLRGAFQVELPLRSLLELRTVASQAEFVATLTWAAEAPGLLASQTEATTSTIIEGEL
jgi:acyl carrier protein